MNCWRIFQNFVNYFKILQKKSIFLRLSPEINCYEGSPGALMRAKGDGEKVHIEK